MSNLFFRKLSLIFFLILVRANIVTAADFYVSPSGSDNNPGTRISPFATIERAKDEVIRIFGDNPNEKCTIWLRGGKYIIEEPLTFSSVDFPVERGSLTIESLPGEVPVISGGVTINNWQKDQSGLWTAHMPDIKGGNLNPRELFLGEKRLIRARHPDSGYLMVKKAGSDRRTFFYFNYGDFPVPAREERPELVFLHDWSISRISVKEIRESENILITVDSIGAKSPDFFNIDNWEPNPRYFLENSIKFLDNDYEWHYDASGDKIYIKLPDAIDPNSYDITIPVSEGLVFLSGSEDHPVKNIQFKGIKFRHSMWQIPGSGYCGVQACHFDPRPLKGGWKVVPAALYAEWAENCSFINCAVENAGGSGLWYSTGCSSCEVVNSLFSDISGNGIMIGEGQDREINGEKWWTARPEQVACGNVIENCTVKNCGVQFSGAVGIWCGLTAETKISRNEIYDLPYTGISIGWMWDTIPTPCRENMIKGNHIHHIMKVLSDGGGIYMLGLQPGSKILKNRIHDVSINAGRAESNGMFLDEGTTDVVVAGNLIYNIAKSPLRFHKATINLVKGNYLFCKKDMPPVRYNNTKEEDIRKIKNKIYNEGESDYQLNLQKVINSWH